MGRYERDDLEFRKKNHLSSLMDGIRTRDSCMFMLLSPYYKQCSPSITGLLNKTE